MTVLAEDILQLVRNDPRLRNELRRELLSDELLELPSEVAALARAQRHTEHQLAQLAARMDQLAARMDQLAARMDQLAAGMEELAESQRQTNRRLDAMAEDLRGLDDWRRGEQRRREGERYERDTVRHAFVVFGGGRGATQTEQDLLRLQQVMAPLIASEVGIEPADDPFLAHVLWLKGARYAVAEVSIAVDRYDIERAAQRAATLRRAGLNVLPVVIGRGWATDDCESCARTSGVEWRIGADASPGYQEYRRLPAA